MVLEVARLIVFALSSSFPPFSSSDDDPYPASSDPNKVDSLCVGVPSFGEAVFGNCTGTGC